jgi:hypothetical protein
MPSQKSKEQLKSQVDFLFKILDNGYGYGYGMVDG